MTKYLTKSIIRDEGVYFTLSLEGIQSVMVGRHCVWKQHEAAGHIASLARKQREVNESALFPFPF